jgi:hypothetical protein
LRTHFALMNAPVADIAFRWLEVEHFRSFVPLGIATQLRDLFVANTRAILGRLVREQTAVAATA